MTYRGDKGKLTADYSDIFTISKREDSTRH